MNWPKDKPLSEGMRRNPVVECRDAWPEIRARGLESRLPEPSTAELARAIPGYQSPHLQTWGRSSSGELVLDPHWIAVSQGTSLHTDMKYPRYSHQLYLRVDPFVLHGVAFRQTKLFRGYYVCFDTHSPHKVSKLDRAACWYFAASVDSHAAEPADKMIPMLLDYASTAPLFAG